MIYSVVEGMQFVHAQALFEGKQFIDAHASSGPSQGAFASDGAESSLELIGSPAAQHGSIQSVASQTESTRAVGSFRYVFGCIDAEFCDKGSHVQRSWRYVHN